jgi:hypothetical protein
MSTYGIASALRQTVRRTGAVLSECNGLLEIEAGYTRTPDANNQAIRF